MRFLNQLAGAALPHLQELYVDQDDGTPDACEIDRTVLAALVPSPR